MSNVNNMSNNPTILPRFKGWTVDKRLKEFRRVHETEGYIITLGFGTEEGDKLLVAYIKETGDYDGII
jgi:hypothetical protein